MILPALSLRSTGPSFHDPSAPSFLQSCTQSQPVSATHWLPEPRQQLWVTSVRDTVPQQVAASNFADRHSRPQLSMTRWSLPSPLLCLMFRINCLAAPTSIPSGKTGNMLLEAVPVQAQLADGRTWHAVSRGA